MTLNQSAFEGVIIDPLPGRSTKPRTRGQTMVIDKGLGLSATGDLLELAGAYIDFMKPYPNQAMRIHIEMHGGEPCVQVDPTRSRGHLHSLVHR